MSVNNEIWKSVPGYEGLYEVSNLGRVKSLARLSGKEKVRSLRERILKPQYDLYGNQQVMTYSSSGSPKTWRVANLVLLTFAGPKPRNAKVCLLDDDKSNVTLKNLRYLTYSKAKSDKSLPLKPQDYYKRLPKTEIVKIRQRRAKGQSAREIAKDYGLTGPAISAICTGRVATDAGGPIIRSVKRKAFTIDEVAKIKTRLVKGESRRQIARDTGASVQTICNIANGTSWQEVPPSNEGIDE